MSETKPKQKIRSLKALEAEKARLRASMQSSREQVMTSYGDARKKVPSYVLKKVALPASLAGLSAFAFRKNKQNEATSYAQSNIDAPKQSAGLRGILFSMLMALVEDWISKR